MCPENQNELVASFVVAIALTAGAAPLSSQANCTFPFQNNTRLVNLTNGPNMAENCDEGFLGWTRSYQPVLSGVSYLLSPAGCDPTSGPCEVIARIHSDTPGNHQNTSPFSNPAVSAQWFNSSNVKIGECSQPGAEITSDIWDADMTGSFSCASGLAGNEGTYRYRTLNRPCTDKEANQTFEWTTQFLRQRYCPQPMKCACGGDCDCRTCIPGPPGGGVGIGGGGPGASPAGSGPGARLRYAAGGAGGPGMPGTGDWQVVLGRFWSHDYAQRVVQDPDIDHVWLITEFATFREFSDRSLVTGLYETRSPTSEYRKLYKTTNGWELRDLEGGLHVFDASGMWRRFEDRNGNAKVANPTGPLTDVTMPDGRREEFTYHASGKLASITEYGVADAASRTWTYTWAGDDLETIGRPDGTSWFFAYEDANHPGFMTRMDLVTTLDAHRVEAAWSYDAAGNVLETWKGDTSFSGPNAVDRFSLAWTNPALPTAVTVTDHLPTPTTSSYTVGREPGSKVARLLTVTGECSVCGATPNSTFVYGDPANPLLPTSIADGNNHVTTFEYNVDGRMTKQTEATGLPLARETTWEYARADFPGFATKIIKPSVDGANQSRTTFTYDGIGNRTEVLAEGSEGGAAYAYATHYGFNSAGKVTSIDPHPAGGNDIVSFMYDSARGDLVPTSRVDPMIGGTTHVLEYDHDPFNRLEAIWDYNGVPKVTTYDELDRVTSVTQGASPDDLVTSYSYNDWGDLLRITLPRGNVIEYGRGTTSVDPQAASWIKTVERKPDASTPGERILYELDDLGRRTSESFQSWNGGGWDTAYMREFEYASRCQLGKIIDAQGRATEYAYDCAGNLDKVWDANHPSADQTAPATTDYGYDVFNRVATVAQPWGGSGGGTVTTTYGYDVHDRLISVTDGNGVTTDYVYSDRGLLTEEVSAVSGTTLHTYDAHGNLSSSLNALGILVTRTYDELDRLTAIDYPTSALDVSQSWGTNAAAFEKGRLVRISRGAANDHHYEYDRYGRMIVDGQLEFDYDDNGNVREVVYPGASVVATYTHDFADRQSTLDVSGTASGPPVVTGASYLPFGPLASMTLGNGNTVTRDHDARYFPSRLSVSGGAMDWEYTTDDVGNVLAIDDLLQSNEDREYRYQDFQYYLTCAAGPWAAGGAACDPLGGQPVQWTYDRVGNRLTENRDGLADSYGYVLSGGNATAKLHQIVFGGGGALDYAYDAVGNVMQESSGGAPVRTFTINAAGLMSRWTEGSASAEFEYDGRGFLVRLGNPSLGGKRRGEERLVHSSDGKLMFREATNFPGALFGDAAWEFYFAGFRIARWNPNSFWGGRPVDYFSLDHLGASVGYMGSTAGLGLEPFGIDWPKNGILGDYGQTGLPGQWSFLELPSSRLFYNLHRWYEPQTGRYTSPDPVGLDALRRAELSGLMPGNLFAYTDGNPVNRFDPLGASWYDWIPGVKCAKFFYYTNRCTRDAECCLQSTGLGSPFSGDEEEMAQRYNDYGGRWSPQWRECIQKVASCQKMAKYAVYCRFWRPTGSGRDPGSAPPVLTP